MQVEDKQRDLINPAVEGTKNVLAAVLKSRKTVRRVIVTSSVVGEAPTEDKSMLPSSSCPLHVPCLSAIFNVRPAILAPGLICATPQIRIQCASWQELP